MSKGREPPVTPRSAHAQGLAPWPPRGGMGLAPRKTRLSRGDAAAEMRHPSGPQLCGTRARGSYESNARRSEAELRRRCGRGGGRRDSVLVGERGTDAPQLRLWWGAPPRPAPPDTNPNPAAAEPTAGSLGAPLPHPPRLAGCVSFPAGRRCVVRSGVAMGHFARRCLAH